MQVENPQDIQGRESLHNSLFSYKKMVFVLLTTLVLAAITYGLISAYRHEQTKNLSKDVLAAQDIVPYTLLKSNLKYILNNSAEIFNGLTISGDIEADGSNLNLGDGEITAANIIYSLTAGTGLAITGGQNPTISLASPGGSGVTSIDDVSGAVDLVAGNNVSLSTEGNKITISASGITTDTNTTYSAGTGLDLDGTTFNVDFDGIGLGDSGSSAASGASVIGVYTGDFSNITTTTPGASLQTVLEVIDTELSTMGGGGITSVGNISAGAAFTSAVPGSNLFIADTGWIGLGSGSGQIFWSDDTIDEISFLNANVGIGLTNPSYTLDVAGSIRTTSDFYIGSTGIGSTAGAGILGVDNANLIYSSASNIQQVLEDLDLAIDNFGTGGSGPWLISNNYAYLNPSLASYLGNSASGGTNKLSGIYLGDNSSLSFGNENDFRILFDGTNFNIGNTSNTFLSIGNSGAAGTFNFNNGQFYIRGDGNVGIDNTNPSYSLDVGNTGRIDHLITSGVANSGRYTGRDVLLTGDGTYSSIVNYALGDRGNTIGIADFNGDGDPDLAVGSGIGNVMIFLNNGDGTFGSGTNYGITSGPWSIAVGNLDGDLDIDIVIGNANTTTVSVLLNNGDGTFATKVDYTVGSAPYGVAIGDVDGDGFNDIAAANVNSNTVSVLVNDGDGTFATKVDYATGTAPYDVDIGDVNGDSDADIVVANSNSSTVSVFLNNGDGTFATKVDYAAGSGSRGVALGDLNGDNDNDIITANQASGTMSVLMNNGDGTFATKVDYDAGSGSRNPALGDFNADGYLDVVISNDSSDDVSLYLNKGDGTFSPRVDYTTGDDPRAVAVGDLNGDGKDDFATSNWGSSNASVFLSTSSTMFYAQSSTSRVGIGTSTPQYTLDVNGAINTSTGLYIGGINIGSSGGSRLIGLDYNNFTYLGSEYVQDAMDEIDSALSTIDTELTNLASGTSVAWTDAGIYLHTTTAGDRIGNPASGGANKIAGLSLGSTAPLIFGATNDFRLMASGSTFLIGDTASTFFSIGDSGTTANFNFNQNQFYIRGDGNVGVGTTAPNYKLDVAGITRSWDVITQNISLSSLSTSLIHAQFGHDGYTNFTGGIGTGGNGKDSLLGAQRLTSAGNLENIGSIQAGEMLLSRGGTFAAKVDYATGTNGWDVAAGDLNGDGKIDFATPNWGADTVSVFINNGAGTYAAKVDYNTGVDPRSIAIGDLNGDGEPDMVVANNGAASVSVFINNGNGTFATKVDYNTGSTPSAVEIGDLNGDGKSEIVVANNGAASASVLTNNGDGTFATKIDFGVGFAPQAVAIGDINGDSRSDIIAANSSSSNVSVHINNGSGGFPSITTYNTGTTPYGVAIGDVNGDKRADIIVANRFSGTASVFINNGNGTFAAKVDYAAGTQPESVSIGDVNGDGKADFAITNVGSATASVFINNGDGTFATKVDYGTGSFPRASLIVDVNSDGKSDLIVSNSSSSTLSVFINNATPIFYAQATTGRVGIGTTSPQYSFDVEGNIRAGTDVYIGSIALGSTAGASILGVNTSGFGVSTAPTVQGQLSALNSAVSAISNPWSDGGNYLYPTNAEFLGISTTAPANKIRGIFLGDTSPLYFGNDNDFRMTYNGTNLLLGDSANTFLSVTDSGTAGTFAFNTDDLYVSSAGRVGIGTASPQAALDVRGDIFTDRWLLSASNTGIGSSVYGGGALAHSSSSEGWYNSAFGANALYSNTTGYMNTALGQQAAYRNTTGDSNIAIGHQSLVFNQSGDRNVVIGVIAAYSNLNNSFSDNTIVGYSAGYSLTSGGNLNTLLGYAAGDQISSGTGNIVIGAGIDAMVASGNNQLNIGNLIRGTLGIGATISGNSTLGTSGGTHAHRIYGTVTADTLYTTTVGVTNRDLYVDNTGVIGYVSSSEKYKENINSLDNIDWIYNLRPVDYEYRNDSTNSLQYGLIAEEVHRINPLLVSYNDEGTPETVSYSKLVTPLLKAVQDQRSAFSNLANDFASLALPELNSFVDNDTFKLLENNFGLLEEAQLEQELQIVEIQGQVADIMSKVDLLDPVASEEADLTSLTERVSFLEQMLFGTEASGSASLAQTEEEADILGVSTEVLENLTVTGKTNVFDLGVTGDMSVGQIVVRGSEAVINSLALPLQIQSTALAPVEIMAGKVSIDTQGNLTVKETVKAKKFEVDKTDTDSASAGTVKIEAGISKIEIKTTALTSSSLIFATPKGIPVSVATQSTGPSKFEILLSEPIDKDIEVNWWIVN